MAEIPIKHKDRRNIWPMLLALLALVIILGFLFGRRHVARPGVANDSTTTSSTTSQTSMGSVAAAGSSSSNAISTFTTFISSTSADRDETSQHAYTADGLRRLADALAASGAPATDLDNIRKQADMLEQSNPSSTQHAGMARSAFLSAADAFASMKSPDASRVRSAAQALQPSPHLLSQKEKVQAFFNASRDALQRMQTSASSGT